MTSLLAGLTNQAASALATGVSPRRFGNAHPSIAPYEVFHARDRDVVIAVGNDKQFRALVAALGVPQLADDARLTTNERRVLVRLELRVELEAALRSRDAADWVGEFTARGVPAGLVNSVSEAIDFATALGLSPTRPPVTGFLRLLANTMAHGG